MNTGLKAVNNLLSQLMKHHGKFVIVIDQVIFSCMTFAVNIISARHLSVENYGILMLVVTAAVLCVGLQRSAFGEPLMIMADSFSSQKFLQRANRSIFFLCLIAGIVFSISAITLIYAYSGVAYIGLFSLTALFLNDAVRFIAAANDRPFLSLLNTSLSSLLQLFLLGILYWRGVSDYIYYLYGWSIAALLGPIITVICFSQLFTKKVCSRTTSFGEYWKLSSRFSLDYAMGILSIQGSLWTATAVTGPAAAAALRGADTLLGPFRIFLQSMPALVLKGWAQTSPASLFKKLAATIGKIWILAAIWNLLFLLIPHNIGEAVMGDSWMVIRPIMALVLASLFPISVSTLCLIALKSLKDTQSVLITRIIVVPIGLIFGVGGACINGASGAATGALISSIIAAIIFIFVVYKTTKNLGIK